ncbi:MAG: sugar phosphate isomerase/epimerase family protein [Clostridiales bacterium]|nr:sugar phosphate isomerase/epimerase family protein [Clostridiales bacterium]
MKLSVAVAGINAIPSAFVVFRGFEESIKKAAEIGYHGIELALKTADEINIDKLAAWLDDSRLEVSCISTGQVFADLGLYFTHPDRDIRNRAVEVFTGIIGLAKDFGKMVNTGRVRGFIGENQSREQAEGLFIDVMRRICDIAGSMGVEIILEPVNRYETNFINNLDEGAELVNKVNRCNVGLMADIFHMNIEDDWIKESLVRNAAYIRYIHLADSNRLAPGWGHIDFDNVFAGLKKVKYDGWVTIEILPKPDPDTAALQAARFILPKLRLYNKAVKESEGL